MKHSTKTRISPPKRPKQTLRRVNTIKRHITSKTTSQTIKSKMSQTETATFGVGCYWGAEHYYGTYFAQKFPGSIEKLTVGFMGGVKPDPTYREVCTGTTGHIEVVQIEFNPNKADYTDLVKFFYALHDPTTYQRQGGDQGEQYSSVIYYHNDIQLKKAQEITKRIQNAYNLNQIQFKNNNKRWENNDITTLIAPATTFYSAHEEHQMYLVKNPNGYCNHSVRITQWPDTVGTTDDINNAIV